MDDMMYITDEMRTELVFWMQASGELSLPITDGLAKCSVETDASNEGYGIYFMGSVISERRRILEHINLAELRVLQKAVTRFGGQMQNGLVT